MPIFRPKDLLSIVSVAQGGYFLLTGVWPLISIGTFMAVTGPKVDIWLVKTVGIVVAVAGFVLLLAGLRRRLTFEIAILAVGNAAGLAAIDIYYVSVGRISPIYLADAVAEIILIILWIALWRAASRSA